MAPVVDFVNEDRYEAFDALSRALFGSAWDKWAEDSDAAAGEEKGEKENEEG